MDAETNQLFMETPLAEWHRSQGGNMAPFGDYLLPLWYTAGARMEHLAVLQSAGIFDTSHMSDLLLEGPDSFLLLQRTFSKDLSHCGRLQTPLAAGCGIYGVFLNEEGHLVDDAIIYRLAETTFFICVNAGKNRIIANHLQQHGAKQNFTLTDLTAATAKIDLQGPNSARILQKILRNPEKHFHSFAPFTCKGDFGASSPLPQVITHGGSSILLARSGYTGEFGFEIFLAADAAQGVWQEIITAGEAFHLLPCGLAARDSLRTGAVLPLAGHDLGAWPFANNPWEFALPPRQADGPFSKSFLGSSALLHLKNPSYTYPFAGFDLRKIDPATAAVFDSDDREIGAVLTCVTDMATDRIDGAIVSTKSPNLPQGFSAKGLSCGFVKVDRPLPFGARITLQDNRRKLPCEIVADIRPHRTARLPLDIFL